MNKLLLIDDSLCNRIWHKLMVAYAHHPKTNFNEFVYDAYGLELEEDTLSGKLFLVFKDEEHKFWFLLEHA